jgi:hypothetical protein
MIVQEAKVNIGLHLQSDDHDYIAQEVSCLLELRKCKK